MHPRILYPARLSLRIQGEIKSFPEKQKLKDFVITKPTARNIKWTLSGKQTRSYKGKKGSEKISRNNDKISNKWQ